MKVEAPKNETPPCGVYPNVAFSVYRQWDAENASGLKPMTISPLRYLCCKAGELDRDTDAMKMGRAVHTAVLEPDRFPKEHVLWDGGVRRGREWDVFCAANSGKNIIKAQEYQECLAIRDAVRRNELAAAILGLPKAETELSVVWVHEPTGTLCKSRIDISTPSPEYVTDLKTGISVEPRAFGRSCANYQYDLSAAFYLDAVSYVMGYKQAKFLIIAVENAPPYDVVVYDVPDSVIQSGREKYTKCLEEVKRCRESGEWPGVASGKRMELEFPDWALPDRQPVGLVVGDEKIRV